MVENLDLDVAETIHGCANCPVKSMAFCCDCTPSDMKSIEAKQFIRHFEPGEQIILEGFSAPFVASIVEGAASMDISLPDGRVQGVGLLLPPDMIGNPPETASKFTVTALSNLTLCCVLPDVFENFLKTYLTISLRVLEMKLEDLDRARNWMTVLGRRSAIEKIAYFIVRIVQKSGARVCENGSIPVDLEVTITREKMGMFLGLTTETVCREMARLEDDGILRARKMRTIRILDYRGLEAIAGIDFDGSVIP